MTNETREQIKIDADAYVKRQGSHSQPDITHHDFTMGATHQHPIAHAQGKKEGRNEVIEEVKQAYLKWMENNDTTPFSRIIESFKK